MTKTQIKINNRVIRQLKKSLYSTFQESIEGMKEDHSEILNVLAYAEELIRLGEEDLGSVVKAMCVTQKEQRLLQELVQEVLDDEKKMAAIFCEKDDAESLFIEEDIWLDTVMHFLLIRSALVRMGTELNYELQLCFGALENRVYFFYRKNHQDHFVFLYGLI